MNRFLCLVGLTFKVKRYILTSAQNNTYVNAPFWKNILALAEHYGAEIMVGTFSYNQNAFGELSVKRGTKKTQAELWYDQELVPYISDARVELGEGLVWCGEMNIIPTAEDPLSGLETYTHRKSADLPACQARHAIHRHNAGRGHEDELHDWVGNPDELHPEESGTQG